ncbi:tetratricopeptide repeat protein [Candidatus Sumerlaeota bacterium]|nr:tetratricopeptide repeat protein [Candidatus Sumerlaeota bacterium]
MDARAHWAVREAQRYLREGNASAAIEIGEHFMSLDVEDLDAFRTVAICLALAYEKAEQLERALQWSAEIRRLYPDDPLVLSVYGRVAMKMGRHGEASAIFRQLAHRYPDQAQYHAAAGTALLRQGEFAGAQHHLERARAFDAGNPYVLNDLANVYLLQGELEASLRTFKQAIEQISRASEIQNPKSRIRNQKDVELANDIRESIEEVRALLLLYRSVSGQIESAQVVEIYPDKSDAARRDGEPQVSEPPSQVLESLPPESQMRSALLEATLARGCRPRHILAAFHLWSDFLETLDRSERQRVEQQPQAWVAAVVYTVGRLHGATWARQAKIARDFGISLSAISRRARRLRRCLSIERADPRYTALAAPVLSHVRLSKL